MSFVRTVTGDVDPLDLGKVDYHEHLFQASPLLPGDELRDERRSTAEARALAASGISAVVEATPLGLGRDPAAVARISAATGLRIVHATGLHRAAHYSPSDPLLVETETELTRRFTREVEAGMGSSGVRAGVVKAAAEYWRLSAYARRGLAAAAATARRTGAPLMVHLEHGSAAHEVLDALELEGVGADRVALAHIDRNPDDVLHRELAARGAFLGYDGWARHARWPDSMLVRCLVATASEASGRRSILLGGDVARSSRYEAYGGLPGLSYLGRRVLPRLRAELGEEALTELTVANPARWLAFRGTSSPAPDSWDAGS